MKNVLVRIIVLKILTFLLELPSPKVIELRGELQQAAQNRRLLTDGTYSRKRKRFTLEEEEMLIRGVVKFGIGCWSKIIERYDFGDRNSVDIKDKWRNMEKHIDNLQMRIMREKARVEKNKAAAAERQESPEKEDEIEEDE
jgi:hypothetical protein